MKDYSTSNEHNQELLKKALECFTLDEVIMLSAMKTDNFIVDSNSNGVLGLALKMRSDNLKKESEYLKSVIESERKMINDIT